MILESIYRYPVKGFSPQSLDSTTLEAGGVIPYDRHWSVAFGGSESVIDTSNPESWVGKRNLLSLSRTPKGAQLSTEFDDKTTRLSIKRNHRIVAQGELNNPSGRSVIESFLNSFYVNTPFQHFHILQADYKGFIDFADSHVSFININTVKDIARIVGAVLNPLRFRGNFLFEAPAWEERKWIGKNICVGGCEFICTEEIERCQATSVSLRKGEIDQNVPLSLRQGFGHIYCGVYAQITKAGTVKAKDSLTVK